MINVLLIDNNPKYLKETLPLYGYRVTTANDVIQALNSLQNIQIDIILIDVMMSGTDEREILKQIRTKSDIPIIMLTAINDESKMVNALRNGADDYIIKPFTLQNLLARMEAVLRRTKTKTSSAKLKNILTKRELEVIKLASEGAKNKDIADKLVLSEITIKGYMYSIFKKLKVKNRTQAVLICKNFKENN